MSKIFQFQEDTGAGSYGDFKKIITYVKFIRPVSCIVFFFLSKKTLLVFVILPSSFHIESTHDKVFIFQQ